jgi:hypothetical protein
MKARNLHAIDDGIEAGTDVRFDTNGVDAGIGTAAIRQFLDTIVGILLLEIGRQCAG